MKLKQIIIVVVIIGALAGAGVLAYKSFGGPAVAPVRDTVAEQAATRNGSILPRGTKLDFTTVKKFNPNNRLFTYPTVKREDTGLPLNDVISQQ